MNGQMKTITNKQEFYVKNAKGKKTTGEKENLL